MAFNNETDRDRTDGLALRRRSLYPTELQSQYYVQLHMCNHRSRSDIIAIEREKLIIG